MVDHSQAQEPENLPVSRYNWQNLINTARSNQKKILSKDACILDAPFRTAEIFAVFLGETPGGDDDFAPSRNDFWGRRH